MNDQQKMVGKIHKAAEYKYGLRYLAKMSGVSLSNLYLLFSGLNSNPSSGTVKKINQVKISKKAIEGEWR